LEAVLEHEGSKAQRLEVELCSVRWSPQDETNHAVKRNARTNSKATGIAPLGRLFDARRETG
jgi:hypothetical protein